MLLRLLRVGERSSLLKSIRILGYDHRYENSDDTEDKWIVIFNKFSSDHDIAWFVASRRFVSILCRLNAFFGYKLRKFPGAWRGIYQTRLNHTSAPRLLQADPGVLFASRQSRF